MFGLNKKNNPTTFNDDDLKKMNQFYIDTSELARVGAWEVDMVTETVTWTKVTRDIHEVDENYTPTLEKGIDFYKPGENRERINILVKNAIEKREPFDEELQIITAKGNERWVRAKGKAEFIKNKCVRLYGVFQDIHAYKLKDLALAYNENFLRQTIDHSPIGIAVTSFDGKILNVNNRCCEIFGYSKDELLQLPFQYIIYPEDISKDVSLLKQLVSGNINNYEIEKRYVHKNEYIVWILLSISLVRDENDEPLHYIMHMMDITSKKESEKALKEERLLLETIIDNIPVNLYVKDLKSRKVLVNKMEVDYMGLETKEKVLGKNDFELYPESSAKISVEEDQKIIRTGKGMLDKETFNQKHDGSSTWFISSKIPLVNETNQVTGILGISHDITVRKHYEEELKRLTEISDNQNLQLMDLTQMVTHNLKSHSANFEGLIHLLENGDADKTEIIETLKKASDNLRSTINNLIDITDLNEKDLDEFKNVNLRRVISKIEESIKNLLIEGKVNLINEVDPEIIISVIPAYLDSIILNFITNSIKYRSADKESFIKFSAVEEKEYIQLLAEDNGAGIDLKKYGKQLFGKNETFHGNKNAKGIGLYLTKKHIEAMGGNIDVQSEPGNGTTFIVTLPNEIF